MVEQRPSAIATAPGCYTAPTAPRGWQYRSQLDMGERPPSSAPAGRQSAVRRDIATQAMESHFTFMSMLMIWHVLVLCIAIFLVVIIIPVGIEAIRKKEPKRAVFLAMLTGAIGFVSLVLGYGSGSVISLDNPTDRPVTISVDGTPYDVAPRSFLDVRVLGPSVAVRAESGGALLEEGTISLDDDPIEALVRVIFGDGRYIYAVCGGNAYSLGYYTYR